MIQDGSISDKCHHTYSQQPEFETGKRKSSNLNIYTVNFYYVCRDIGLASYVWTSLPVYLAGQHRQTTADHKHVPWVTSRLLLPSLQQFLLPCPGHWSVANSHCMIRINIGELFRLSPLHTYLVLFF